LIQTVHQRQTWDCGHACIAMWAKVPYGIVQKRAISLDMYSEGLGEYQFKTISESFGIKPFTIDQAYGGLDGVLCFPSLNNPGGAHAVYLNDHKIYDPSNKKKYLTHFSPWPSCYLLTIDLNDAYSNEMAGEWLESKKRIFEMGQV